MLKNWFKSLKLSHVARRRPGSRMIETEALDARIMLSATATLSKGVLTVKGDAQDANNLSFSSISGGIRVTSSNGINGNNSFVDFEGVTSIKVTTGALDDSISLAGVTIQNLTLNLGDGGNSVSISNSVVNGKLAVTTGDGNDSINLYASALFSQSSVLTLGGPVSISTGDGNDSVSIYATSAFETSSSTVTLSGPVKITTGNGDDNVRIDADATFDFSHSQLTANGPISINTGNNNDTISVYTSGVLDSANSQMHLQGALTVAAGNGENTVSVYSSGNSSLAIGAVKVSTGSDDDSVSFGNFGSNNIAIGGLLTVSTGSGDDQLLLSHIQQSVAGGSNKVSMGQGDDDATIQSGLFSTTSSLNMGNRGEKSLAIDDMTFQGSASLVSQGVHDVIRIEAGFLPGATEFDGKVTMSLGAGTQVTLGVNDGTSQTNFLGSVAVTGHGDPAVITQASGHVTFALPPVLKKATLSP